MQSSSVPRANRHCKLCQMIEKSDDLARLLYVYRFEEKLALRALLIAITPHVEKWNLEHTDAPISLFSIKAMSNHFNKHTPSNEQMQYHLQNKINGPRGPVTQPMTSPIVQQAIAKQISKTVSTFDEMADLFVKLKVMFEEYTLTRPQITALTIHLDIMREMRKILAEISKMRQSKELVKIAVRSVIDTFLTQIIDNSGKSIDDLRDKLIKRFRDPSAASAVTEEFRKAMVDSIVESARVAIDRVRTEFALDSKDE